MRGFNFVPIRSDQRTHAICLFSRVEINRPLHEQIKFTRVKRPYWKAKAALMKTHDLHGSSLAEFLSICSFLAQEKYNSS